MKNDLKPATYPLDTPQRCLKCGWRGLLSAAVEVLVAEVLTAVCSHLR